MKRAEIELLKLLFPDQMQGDLAVMRGVAMFEQVNALPCAQNRTTVCDRDGQ